MKAGGGYVLILLGLSLLFVLPVWGKWFSIGSTEINLRDPLLVLNKSLGFMLLGLLLTGKSEALLSRFSKLGVPKNMLLWTSLFTLIFVFLSLFRYYAVSCNTYDFALFENIFYHIAFLKDLHSFVNHRLHIFNGHLCPIFFVYALIYRLWGITGCIVVHKIALAMSIPLTYYLISTLENGNSQQGEAKGYAILLLSFAPAFFKLGVQDLYPEALVLPLGLALLLSFYRKKWGFLLLSAVSLLLIREDTGILLAAIFIYLRLKHNCKKCGRMAVIVLLITAALFYIQSIFAGPLPSKFAVRYGLRSFYDLKGFLHLLINVIKPLSIATFAFHCLGFGLLPFMEWKPALAAYMVAAPHLVSRYWRQKFLTGYYPIFEYPLLYLAVILSFLRLKNHNLKTHTVLALAFALLMGPRNITHRLDRDYILAANRAISAIPPGVPVAATFKLASRLGGRPILYVLVNSPHFQSPARAPFVLIEETDLFYRNWWQEALRILKSKGYVEILDEAGVHLLMLPQ